MDDVNLVSEAFKFMALGMGIVFLFLTVLIFALKLQAKLIAKFFPVKPQDIKSVRQPKKTNNVDDTETIAAITAAIIHHNNNKG